MTNCPSCSSLLERNARLVVCLKKRVAALHALENHAGVWYRCTNPACLEAFELIENKRAPHRAA